MRENLLHTQELIKDQLHTSKEYIGQRILHILNSERKEQKERSNSIHLLIADQLISALINHESISTEDLAAYYKTMLSIDTLSTKKIISLYEEIKITHILFNEDIEIYTGSGGFDLDGGTRYFTQGDRITTILPVNSYQQYNDGHVPVYSKEQNISVHIPLGTYVGKQKAQFDYIK